MTSEVKAKNRLEGWAVRPALALVGFDGGHEIVGWDDLTVEGGNAFIEGDELRLPGRERGRFVKALVRGVSTGQLPVPAEETGIDVVLRRSGPLLDATSGRSS